jgi:CheY-like chemotaxis protein
MNSNQVIELVNAIAQLLGVLIWPAVLIFFLVRFPAALADFFANLGEISLRTPGLEATARRRQVEAAAALGAAIAARAPIDDTQATAADPRDVAEALPTPRAQRRLQGNNRFERQALEAYGMNIDQSTSTEDAVGKIRRRPYDLIISDMGRPPDSRAGYTLLDQLRRTGDKTPYIIYSGSRAPEDVQEARQHGALGSTNSPQELITIVTKALS